MIKYFNIKITLLIVLSLITFESISQVEKSHHNHNHSAGEIGASLSYYYLVKAEEFNPGVHVHYVYYFPHSRFGIGAGYEGIFDEHHTHHTFGIVGTVNPIANLIVGVSPGITFEENLSGERFFSLHFEATYGFNIGRVHIGPSVGYAISEEDQHISAGFHIGFDL